MITLKQIITITILVFCISLWQSCAVVRAPEGGIVDDQPPKLNNTKPNNFTTNFSEKKIVFEFNENITISNPNVILVSPPLEVQPTVFVKGKKLTVDFEDIILDSITYSLTINNEVSDLTEKNKLSEPIHYLFSTTNRIDTTSVSGEVIDAFTKRPVKNATVMLYVSDSIVDNNFFQKQPAYLTMSNDIGVFTFQGTREGNYRILSVLDDDKSFTYSRPDELVGLRIDEPIIVTSESNDIRNIQLLSCIPDTASPKILQISQEYRDIFTIAFNEPVASFKININDTIHYVWKSEKPWFRERKARVYLPISELRLDSCLVYFSSIEDTIGNIADTMAYFSSKDTSLFKPLTIELESHDEGKIVLSSSYPIASESLKHIQLIDTFDFKPDYTVTCDGLKLRIAYKYDPKNISKFGFQIKKELFSENGLRLDSLIKLVFESFIIENKSILSGSIVNHKSTIKLFLLNSENRIVAMTDNAEFSFNSLPAGTYRFLLIEDSNSNGVWNAGRFSPYISPEKSYWPSTTIELRKDWQVENIQLKWPYE